MNERPHNAPFTLLWLLPIAFVVHDAEELVTLPGWVASHRMQLAQMFAAIDGGASTVDRLPTSAAEIACAIGVVLVLFLAVTAGACRARGRGVWTAAYAVLLGGFFLHGFTHLGQTAYFGEYTPGAATAAVVVIPVSLYLYRWLLRERVLTRRAAVWGAVAGIALLVPALLLAFAFGAIVTSR